MVIDIKTRHWRHPIALSHESNKETRGQYRRTCTRTLETYHRHHERHLSFFLVKNRQLYSVPATTAAAPCLIEGHGIETVANLMDGNAGRMVER